MLNTIKKWFKHSVTILLARVTTLVGIVMVDPTINDAIKGLIKPIYLPYYVIAMGILFELARRRTAGQNDGSS